MAYQQVGASKIHHSTERSGYNNNFDPQTNPNQSQSPRRRQNHRRPQIVRPSHHNPPCQPKNEKPRSADALPSKHTDESGQKEAKKQEGIVYNQPALVCRKRYRSCVWVSRSERCWLEQPRGCWCCRGGVGGFLRCGFLCLRCVVFAFFVRVSSGIRVSVTSFIRGMIHINTIDAFDIRLGRGLEVGCQFSCSPPPNAVFWGNG